MSARNHFADCAYARGDLLICQNQFECGSCPRAPAASLRLRKQQPREPLVHFMERERLYKLRASPEPPRAHLERGKRYLRVVEA